MHKTKRKNEALPAVPENDIPDVLPLLTVADQVVFPLSLVPIHIESDDQRAMLRTTARGDKYLVMLTLREPGDGHSGLENTYEVGCIGRLVQVQQTQDGDFNVVVQALKRCRALGIVQQEPYVTLRVQPLAVPQEQNDEVNALMTTVKLQMSSLISLSPAIPEGAQSIVDNIDDPSFLADLVAGNLNISVEEKQKILTTLSATERLRRLTYLLAREVEMMELSNKIHREVKSSIDKGQREYFLRQQMKAIQDELGESGEQQPELVDYREKLDALHLPEEVMREVKRELNRLSRMNEASAEYHIISTYLDTLVELPWNIATEDRLDVERAEKILNEDHYGLAKVKRRILEYLAVRKLKPDAQGPILCFLGPPGVGKTSLGKSIARATNRNFIRMSLGGVRDEAEIRGHRKTYVGALPGRIIQNIRKAGSSNPVFMLDEIDKLGNDFRGDPSSALLEVLDPAQNDTFVDHYLNVPWDLSKVMFIATANMGDTIPWALRDRMEIIEIPGYTEEEKLEIAQRYLVPRQLEANGLMAKHLRFNKTALRSIITGYTREAGVRNLERQIGSVCRGVARKVATGLTKPVSIKPDDLHEYLGAERIQWDAAERTKLPGVAMGLAWTATGGDLLFIEATIMPGKGNLLLTGQLGEVMKESAQAALSYLRTNAEALNIDRERLTHSDIHVHVPAGAIPKDGPSAGVTMLTAMSSVLLGKHVKLRLAMTGEITLRGAVLPVGGIKEKVLAASRAGIKELILPERNRNDLDEVPESVQQKMRVHFVGRMGEVLEIALNLKSGAA
jgi:ATP-dependent Lon protease